MHTANSARRLCQGAFAFIIVLSLATIAVQASAATLKLAYGTADQSTYGHFAKVFAEEVQTLTDESVKVRTFCCLKMGGEQEMFKKLQLGTLDGTIIAQNNAGPFYPKLDILTLPYVFQNAEHAQTIVNGPIGQQIWADMPDATGVHLIAITSVAFRHIFNTKHPIQNLDDFKPLKYRVPKNTVMVDTYDAFGSDPVPLAWTEALTAVQTGAVDGGDLSLDILHSQKFYEIAKHVAMTGHFVLAPPFFVSDRFMKKLSDAERAAVYQAANTAAASTAKMLADYEASLTEELQAKHGVTFTHPDRAPRRRSFT